MYSLKSHIEIYIYMHSFPVPLIAYELIPSNTQISQLYCDTQTSYEIETQT
jgi:hypothetical protein